MQNNCNPLIPWKTFLMRKIWQFSAPSKSNWVAQARDWCGSARLKPEWLLGILDSGHLSSSSSSTFMWRQREQEEDRRKVEMRKVEFMVCWQVGIVKLHMNMCSSCLALSKRWHLVPSPQTDTTFPMFALPLHTLKHCLCFPLSRLTSFSVACGFECQHGVGIRHQRNKNTTKRCKTLCHKTSPIFPLKILHAIPFICVESCQIQSLKKTGGLAAPGIFRNAPFV